MLTMHTVRCLQEFSGINLFEHYARNLAEPASNYQIAPGQTVWETDAFLAPVLVHSSTELTPRCYSSLVHTPHGFLHPSGRSLSRIVHLFCN